ncbi:MAG TPA: response regulator transcription factor [Solirubrobacterales bacterium]|nr:response regulator transcription factor [Solirubrobacterales bacterium]
MISVLVADDHPIVREHLAEVIDADERLQLCGEAGDGAEALLKADELSPDAVVLDLAMPVLDGSAVLKRLRERRLPIRVLLLSGHADVAQMRSALRHRPDSLLLMNATAREICEEVIAIETDVLSRGRLNLERAQLLVRNRIELSGREWEVLKLSADGLTRAEIGERLRFGSSTVRDIRHDICTKLNAPSMQVAVVVAMRAGLLEVGSPHPIREPAVDVLKIA